MKSFINLWEAVTFALRKQEAEGDVPVGMSPTKPASFLRDIQASSRWAGQEVELDLKRDGWEIRVFSCYDPQETIVLKIPKSRRKMPVLEYTRIVPGEDTE